MCNTYMHHLHLVNAHLSMLCEHRQFENYGLKHLEGKVAKYIDIAIVSFRILHVFLVSI